VVLELKEVSRLSETKVGGNLFVVEAQEALSFLDRRNSAIPLPLHDAKDKREIESSRARSMSLTGKLFLFVLRVRVTALQLTFSCFNDSIVPFLSMSLHGMLLPGTHPRNLM